MKRITLFFVMMMVTGAVFAQEAIELAPAQVSEVEGFNPAAKRVYAQLSCEGHCSAAR